jgi:hypothetical protein
MMPPVDVRGGVMRRLFVSHVALLTLLALGAVGCASTAERRVVRSAAGTSTPVASPTASPPVVRYPGSAYVVVADACPRVEYESLMPDIFEVVEKAYSAPLDARTTGAKMSCDRQFKRSTAGIMGGGHLDVTAWVYVNASDAVVDYNQLRTESRAKFRPAGAQVADINGVGERASEIYVPHDPGNDPHVRIQPARRYQLLVLDKNLVVSYSVYSSLNWSEPFKTSDQQFRQRVRESVNRTMAALRS